MDNERSGETVDSHLTYFMYIYIRWFQGNGTLCDTNLVVGELLSMDEFEQRCIFTSQVTYTVEDVHIRSYQIMNTYTVEHVHIRS